LESEILTILREPIGIGARVGEIADQFRDGRDVSHLLGLLDSKHADVVSIGAWILGEIHFELYDSITFLDRLRVLLDHEDPSVRFHALGALFPALNREDPDTHALLARLASDPNEGVRLSAKAAAARLGV